MKAPESLVRSALAWALALLVLPLVAPAQTLQKSYVFDGSTSLEGASLYGSAKIVASPGYLSLTELLKNQNGVIIADPFPADEAVTSLNVDLGLRIQQITTPPADGLSFNFGPDLVNQKIGEDGATNGFVVTFDIYTSSTTDSAPAVEIVYDGEILAGATFAGRATNRPPIWPLATNQSGAVLSLNTGTNFVPVSIAVDTNHLASVTWDGTTILTNVPVPFAPKPGWRIAVGARTGSAMERHHLESIELAATLGTPVTVTTSFGGNLVSPAAGDWVFPVGTTRRFSAPQYIYLDRFKNTLGTDPTSLGETPYYRARYAGVSIDGGGINHVDDDSFLVTLKSQMTVDWQWELEYLGEVHTGTEDLAGLSPSDVTDTAHADDIGRQFYGTGARAGEIFSSAVYAAVGGPDSGLPIQFAAKAYLLENAPNPPERSVVFTSGQDHLRADAPGIPWGTLTNYTMEFWARAEPSASTVARAVVGAGRRTAGSQVFAGFLPDGSVILSGGPASRQFAVPQDTDWHHWALVGDEESKAVALYRDGKQVGQQSFLPLGLSDVEDVLIVGGTVAPNGTALERPFSGGANNVRIWSLARSAGQISEGMLTPSYGTNVAGLELELTADTPEFDPSGLLTQLWRGVGRTNINSVTQITNLTLISSSIGPDISIPTTAPSTNFGVIYQGRLDIPATNTYTFYLNSDDGSRLLIDGQVVVDHDGTHGPSEKSGSVSLNAGQHDLTVLFFQGGGGVTFEVRYSSASISKRLIPADALSLGSELALFSTEGRNRIFLFRGAADAFPDTPTPVEMVRTLFPGFEYKRVSGTGVNQIHLTDGTGRELTYAVNDWTRVTWEWEKQYLLQVKVAASDPSSLAAVARLPFLGGDVNLEASTSSSASIDSGLNVTVLKEWVPALAAVTVGTRYRTPDGCYQLAGITGQVNAFGSISMDTVVDGAAADGAVTRQYAFPGGIDGPGTLVFNFGPTIHRAEIPIGTGLDVSSTTAADAQLVPDLCGTLPFLLISRNGPTVSRAPAVGADGAIAGGTGLPYAWDVVGKSFYPLVPGIYSLTWQDAAIPGKSYQIEIHAEFPTTTVTIADRERQDGSRQGSAPDYLTAVTYPGTATAYPANPVAHYHYVVSPNHQDPIPAQLDPDSGDRWSFQRLAYSEDTSASADAQTTLFTDTTTDSRTVLLFSYRTNAAEVATGDLTREALAVRIVQSLDVSQSETNLTATVGSRIQSDLDTAAYGSGFLLYELSNYNPQIYLRDAEVGAWGPIYPVNWSGLFQADNRRLRVAWYQNPYLQAPTSVLHPNVGWPYVVGNYDDVQFPGEDGNLIYIASRLGSEGVNAAGSDQRVFDPALYANLAIYNQPDPDAPGYNPNEEHALVAPSIKDQLTGDQSFNLGQVAAFALQRDINLYGATDSDTGSSTNRAEEFTSEPVVLVQYDNLASGGKEMMAYRVEATRAGAEPFPRLDPETHLPTDPLGQPVEQPSNPAYSFDYPGFAGDPVIQPYPLNLVVGSVVMEEDQGGNYQVNGVNRRTLWFDKNQTAWMVSGDGRFFYQFWYPFRQDFWFDANHDGQGDLDTGTPLAWLSTNGVFVTQAGGGSPVPSPRRIDFDTYWRTTYPVLKRGESLTYAGGEYLAENPAAQGLPGILGWASAQLVFDSLTPDMVYTNLASLGLYSARVVRPLDDYEVEVALTDMPSELTPANTDKVMVVGTRWHFKDLIGSLQKRLYYDSLSHQLVFRGRLNDLESGDGNLTAQPVSLYVLEPNVMTPGDVADAQALASGNDLWAQAIESLYLTSQNPQGLLFEGTNPASVDNPVYLSGVDPRVSGSEKKVCFYGTNGNLLSCDDQGTGSYSPLNSLGSGSALVPNPSLLTATNAGPYYVTLVENNHPDVEAAVALHIIELNDERFRGAIKLIEAQNVFDDKVNLKHTADFGGNTADTYYQWWVRDVASLGAAGLPGDNPDWQLYAQGPGLNQIAFTGRPDVALADKFFYVRYGEVSEFVAQGSNPASGSVPDSNWRLVDINDPTDGYARSPGSRTPYQWAGAANSPQAQADGSLAYVPQLVMGWVKRVLDRINPYEARFNDFAGNDSPAVYSSLLRSAGAPYVGDVALNADKDVIENVGLIQLYETVLHRAKSLTLDISGASTPATDQALLLAATRLVELYELLAREAYNDAQNSTVLISPDNGLAAAAPFVFAFYNQEASLLDEELALLRGTDFLKAYPVYNRLFWNYVKGLGEAAYNANYPVEDVNQDGFINEFDAAAAYPQGHGDAWGHFLSAGRMYYELLQNTAFDWSARSEFYSLLDNVIPADYLDEKSFARVAAAKARAGKAIVAATYREAYTSDPAGQWQGYTDLADPARAWGVSEWAKRAGMGAAFDWIVGNALVPDGATNSATANDLDLASAAHLDRIDRQANQAELSEIAAACFAIQNTLDSANAGNNPLGLDSDAVAFDVDPLYNGRTWDRRTHFEQIADRAEQAARNAVASLEFASQADQQLARLDADSEELRRDAIRQDLDYRSRLIEIFGMPYAGTVGAGKPYPEGYAGPDLLLYAYIDQTDPESFVPETSPHFATIDPKAMANSYASLDFKVWIANVTLDSIPKLFDDLFLTQNLTDNAPGDGLPVQVPVIQASDYALRAPTAWGKRAANGRIQDILHEMLAAQIDLEVSTEGYSDYVEGMLIRTSRLQTYLDTLKNEKTVFAEYLRTAKILEGISAAAEAAQKFMDGKVDDAFHEAQAIAAFMPQVNGLDNDVTSAARGLALQAGAIASAAFDDLGFLATVTKITTTGTASILDAVREGDDKNIELHKDLVDNLAEYSEALQEEPTHRLELAKDIQHLHSLAHAYESAVSDGFGLLNERGALNKFIAASVQKGRYQDMALRLTRNDALAKYESAFAHAQRYAWLAAKAYEYETNLDPGHPASATSLLDRIVRARQLGAWVDGEPRTGNGGLAEILAQLQDNFSVLKGQLGIGNPQYETDRLSLRYENFRILKGDVATPSSADAWRQALQMARVDDLRQLPEFVQYCRPFASEGDEAEPGLVIEFATEISRGENAFGKTLTEGDHAFSSANFATKIQSVGVLLEGYGALGLSAAPRFYLVPAGTDRIRTSDSRSPTVRDWNIVEQRIPVPFIINDANLRDPNFIPSLASTDGSFAERRRFGDLRAYDADLTSDDDAMSPVTRLVGRSVWNTRWLLIIPGATFDADAQAGLERLIGSADSPGISDILIQFETYSHEGM